MLSGTPGSHEHHEAAWISMTDLFLLVSILLLAAIGHLAVQNGENAVRMRSLLLESSVARSDAEAARQELAAATAELGRLKEVLDKPGMAEALRKDLETANSELARLRTEWSGPEVTEGLRRQPEAAGARIDALTKDAAEAASLALELAKARDELAALRARVSSGEAAARDREEARAAAAEALARLAAAEQRVEQCLAQRQQSIQAAEEIRLTQGVVNQQLLGISGSLDRAVFVFDRSFSMNSDNRWEFTRQTMRIWLEMLPVREAAVVVFNDEVLQFPPGQKALLPLTAANRERLASSLDGLVPTGRTDTAGALQKAYQYEPIDAIILFTDGAPDDSERVTNVVSKMVARFPGTRIHVVGLGDYFNEDFGRFLKNLASQTGGAFIGR